MTSRQSAQQHSAQQSARQQAQDYARIEKALAYIRDNFRDQPELDDIADAAALSPFHFQRLFTRWAGVSPKQFLGYLTLDHAKRSLDRAQSVLDAAYDAGLSGPSRLHDLFVNFEGITPGQYKDMGAGLDIRYGVHHGFLGDFVVALTDRGICALQFFGPEDGPEDTLADIRKRLPGASFRPAQDETWAACESVFGAARGNPAKPLRLWYRGTNFQIKVWQALLSIPPRVIRATDLFDTGYRWGTERKLALIGWEQAQAETAENTGEPARATA